ncbi:MAG: TetR/AcrR family transcriptional regulator, partial [Gammaproteobacteria bacterium]
EAVDRACEAFWQFGYQALGLRDIEARTGLNRFAIHTEFGGKEGLFLEVLGRYGDYTEREVFSRLKGGGVDHIRGFFEALVSAAEAHPCQAYGCLMFNSAVEPATAALPAVRRRTRAFIDCLHEALGAALLKSQNEGQLSPELDVREAAAFLVGCAAGIHVLNRSSQDVRAGEPVARTVNRTLRSWCCFGQPTHDPFTRRAGE